MKTKIKQPSFIDFANSRGKFDGIKVRDGVNKKTVYNTLSTGHKNLRKLLDQIIKAKKISMTKELKYFIDRLPFHKQAFIVKNGELIPILKYALEDERLETRPDWFRRINFELIKYLIDRNEDKRKLKKCPICNKYFIANNIRRKKCESEECSREYRRQQKAKQRESDPERYV
jgi:hypothetical protein